MHEAGIAVALAREIRDRRLSPSAIRVVVTGGHDDDDAFDAALRAHLEAAAPDLDLGGVAIVHAPAPRICLDCATPFEGLGEAACPSCGGAGLALPTPEQVELEWAAGDDGPLIPSPRDGRHSRRARASRRL